MRTKRNCLAIGLLWFVLLALAAQAETKSVELEVVGLGPTRADAISAALVEALRQSSGFDMKSEEVRSKIVRQISSYLNGNTKESGDVDAHSSGTIRYSTQGFVEKYRVLAAAPNSTGLFEATLRVTVGQHVTGGRDLLILVEERGAGGDRRSLTEAIVAERFRDLQFRVIDAQEIGKDNEQVLRDAAENRSDQGLNPGARRLADYIVSGWVETRPGADNLGWTVSVLADGQLRLVNLKTGELVASAHVFGERGFGSHEDRAAADAVKNAATELSRKLADQVNP